MSHLIVDAHYLLHRVSRIPSFGKMTRPDGMPSGGCYGFLKTLHSTFGKLSTINKCTAVFDAGYSARRKEISPEYKSNRGADDEEAKAYRSAFRSQKIYIKYILTKLGCRVVEVHNREADDVIYWLAATSEGKKIVLSDDKDMLQNVRTNTNVYRPMAEQIVTVENFEELSGLPRKSYLLARAMIGDKSDCIFGVKGVGPKRAAQLVQEASTVEDLIELCKNGKNAFHKKVTEAEDQIRMNLELLDLSKEVFTNDDIEKVTAIMNTPVKLDLGKAMEFFRVMGYKSFYSEGNGAGGAQELTRWIAPWHLLK